MTHQLNSSSSSGGPVYKRWRGLIHARKVGRFYAQFIQPGALVFDVGAYRGSRTHVFLRLGARVIAVEPVKESVRTLFVRFHDNSRVRIIPKALGAAEGTGDILLSQPFQYSSSLNRGYTQAGAESGRYAAYGVEAWQETRTVNVTTLDELIAECGLPAFTKIDVEGYEDQVLKGLTQPLPALSFEFHPHFLEPALQSIDYLRRFGPMRMNYAIEERFKWMLDRWVTPEELIPMLKSYQPETDFLYGDVYVRFAEHTATPHP